MTLWRDAWRIASDNKSFRTRDREAHFRLITMLRSATTVLYHFLEAYLNGLAFDCTHNFHDKLVPGDHDLLTEWNSKTKRQRFVAFDRKLVEYPKVVGTYFKENVAISG
jgi:hypothetical protein